MTVHPQELEHAGIGSGDEASCRRAPRRNDTNPLIRIGWNIAGIVLGGKIREARARALFQDMEGAAAFSRRHQRAMRSKWREMLQHVPVDD